MKFGKTAGILASVAALFGTFAIAASHAGPHDAAIKARQAQMDLYAFNLGQLGDMAKGTVDYDAKAAQAAASNLAALSALDQSKIWPEGSDNFDNENTRALPDIWQNLPDVFAKAGALAEAAKAMEDAAGTDLAALQAAMGPLGGACGACHKAYRAPES